MGLLSSLIFKKKIIVYKFLTHIMSIIISNIIFNGEYLKVPNPSVCLCRTLNSLQLPGDADTEAQLCANTNKQVFLNIIYNKSFAPSFNFTVCLSVCVDRSNLRRYKVA